MFAHGDRLPAMVAETVAQTRDMGSDLGWVAVAALLLRLFARWRHVHRHRGGVEQRAIPCRARRTGKWTMFYMALSLAFTAAGIIVLYLLWDARHVDGLRSMRDFRSNHRQFRLGPPWLNAGTLSSSLRSRRGCFWWL
jgi:hypothetical protein